MRLKSLLKEQNNLEIDIQEAADLIKKECEPFLNEIGDGFLYRGFAFGSSSAKNINSVIAEHIPRKNRQPRYVSPELHEFLSKISKKIFGWDARQEGVFAGSFRTSKIFGDIKEKPRAIFPIGKYNYVLLIGQNLNNLYHLYDVYTLGRPGDKKILTDIEWTIKTQYLQNRGLRSAAKNQKEDWECIIKCKKYYSIPWSLQNDVMEKIKAK
jgi:hypothetical protein